MNEKQVLVIGACEKTRQQLNALLTRDGMGGRTAYADSLNAAISANYHPDIIILSTALSNVGITASAGMLMSYYTGVPIIISCSKEEEKAAMEAIDAGAQDYFFADNTDSCTLQKMMQCALVRAKMVNDYKRLFDDTPGAMYIYDVDTLEFLQVNNATLLQYGYTREELLQLTTVSIRPEEELDRYYATLRKLNAVYFDAGRWRHMKKDGTVFHVHIYSHATMFEGRNARVVMAVDIDEKVKIEAANNMLTERVNKQGERMENILSSIKESVWSCCAETLVVTYSNNASLDIFGYAPDELIGKSHTLMNNIHPEDRKSVDEKIARIWETKADTIYFRIYSKTGDLKHIHTEVILHKDAEGRDLLTGVSTDVTAQLEYQLRIEAQNKKLQEISWMQSHKMRSPVATIMGLVQLLKPEKLDSDTAQIISNILAATQKLDEAIKEVTEHIAVDTQTQSN